MRGRDYFRPENPFPPWSHLDALLRNNWLWPDEVSGGEWGRMKGEVSIVSLTGVSKLCDLAPFNAWPWSPVLFPMAAAKFTATRRRTLRRYHSSVAVDEDQAGMDWLANYLATSRTAGSSPDTTGAALPPRVSAYSSSASESRANENQPDRRERVTSGFTVGAKPRGTCGETLSNRFAHLDVPPGGLFNAKPPRRRKTGEL